MVLYMARWIVLSPPLGMNFRAVEVKKVKAYFHCGAQMVTWEW